MGCGEPAIWIQQSMRKGFRVKKYKRAHGKYVVEGRENGKRSRKFFATKDVLTDAIYLQRILMLFYL